MLLAAFAVQAGWAQADPAANLMPMPTQVERSKGALKVDTAFSVSLSGYREPRLERAVLRFTRDLAWRTGLRIQSNSRTSASGVATLILHTAHASQTVQQVGEDESYVLTVSSTGAQLDAPTPLGTMHGLQTLLQMVSDSADGFVIPAATIRDQPRFPWRGLLMDVSRHFMPVSVIQRNLDGMAAVKMNVLHWHLSDDQGFRVECRRYPKLHGMGSDGDFYTQKEIRQVIAYAHDRGIRVVPEFDMPGHSTSWLAGYPQLGSGPKPYAVQHHYGESGHAMNPTRETTFVFLAGFIAEMAKLFPDRYFHIGGDEVDGKVWDSEPEIVAYKLKHDIKTNADLQARFNQRLEKIVSHNGKIMMGWDEVLHPALPKSVLLQSWRGQDSLAQAAKQGFRGLLSYGYYLDLMWPAERHYAVDPLSGPAAQLTPDEQKLVLGGEACMWAEYVSPETVDSRIWPRAAVIAERLWSSQSVTDVTSMYRRMGEVSWRLDGLGLTHNSGYATMLHRIADGADTSPLRTLADAVEPVKDYERGSDTVATETTVTPLIRLVDAARPESLVARQLNQQVDQYLAGGAKDPSLAARIRLSLRQWSNELPSLRLDESIPVTVEDPSSGGAIVAIRPADSSGQLSQTASALEQTDLQVLRRNLSALGDLGIAALSALETGKSLDNAMAWRQQAWAELDRAAKPRAEVEIAILPAVRKLVDAAAPATK